MIIRRGWGASRGRRQILAILTDAHSAGIIMMVITSVDGNSLTYEYTNLVTGETTTQTSTVQDFVERIQPGLVKDDASISVRETVYGPRLCYNVRVDNADGTITYIRWGSEAASSISSRTSWPTGP